MAQRRGRAFHRAQSGESGRKTNLGRPRLDVRACGDENLVPRGDQSLAQGDERAERSVHRCGTAQYAHAFLVSS
jgi:hypothetical protein